MRLFASSLVINTVQNPSSRSNIYPACYSSSGFSYCFHIIDTYFYISIKYSENIARLQQNSSELYKDGHFPLTGRLIIIIIIIINIFSAAKRNIRHIQESYSILLNTSTELLPHTHRETWEGHALKSLCLNSNVHSGSSAWVW